MLDSKALRSLVAVAALGFAAAACADGQGATMENTVAGPDLEPSLSRGPSSLPGLLHGFKRIVDLTQTLDENTPVIALPAPFANSPGFTREEISFFDYPRGPGWAWYSINLGEHTGTHFDVPCHWASGRTKACVDEVPVEDLVGPAVVIDVRDKVAADPDYLVTVEDARAWERKYGRIPPRAWVILQTGWSSRYNDPAAYLNDGHTPGPSAELSSFLVFERDALGIGVETVGTDAGMAGGFEVPFPNHDIMLGAGRYGIASLTNVDQLPKRGAVLIVAPMKIGRGTGSPARVLALVP